MYKTCVNYWMQIQSHHAQTTAGALVTTVCVCALAVLNVTFHKVEPETTMGGGDGMLYKPMDLNL